jgi:hypothetical protein
MLGGSRSRVSLPLMAEGAATPTGAQFSSKPCVSRGSQGNDTLPTSLLTESAIRIAAQRAFFWKEVTAQLDQLADRISKENRKRFEGLIEQKVPRLTRKQYDECIKKRTAPGLEEFEEFPSFQACGRKRA